MTDTEKAQLEAADSAAFRHVLNALFALAGKLRGLRQAATITVAVNASGGVQFFARIAEELRSAEVPDMEPRESESITTTFSTMEVLNSPDLNHARLCLEKSAESFLRRP